MDKKPWPKDSKEGIETLKAWCHWVLLNPMDEDQEAMAKAVNDLFSLHGNLLHKNLALAIENKGLRMEIEALKAAAWRPSLPSEEKHSDDFDKIDR